MVFDESVPPDPTLEEAPMKPKVQLQQDPRQAEVSKMTTLQSLSEDSFFSSPFCQDAR